MENPPVWTEEAKATFLEIKATLGQAPVLGLPNIEKPFNLFVHEKEKVADRWPLARPVAVEEAGPVATGWPQFCSLRKQINSPWDTN